MTTTLKNGMTVEDPRLDRIYEEDWRSLNYAVGDELVKLDQPIYRPRSYTWSIDKNLDQRAEGACVGFAFAHDLAARPVPVSGVTDEYARSLTLLRSASTRGQVEPTLVLVPSMKELAF